MTVLELIQLASSLSENCSRNQPIAIRPTDEYRFVYFVGDAYGTIQHLLMKCSSNFLTVFNFILKAERSHLTLNVFSEANFVSYKIKRSHIQFNIYCSVVSFVLQQNIMFYDVEQCVIN